MPPLLLARKSATWFLILLLTKVGPCSTKVDHAALAFICYTKVGPWSTKVYHVAFAFYATPMLPCSIGVDHSALASGSICLPLLVEDEAVQGFVLGLCSESNLVSEVPVGVLQALERSEPHLLELLVSCLLFIGESGGAHSLFGDTTLVELPVVGEDGVGVGTNLSLHIVDVVFECNFSHRF